MGAQNKPKRLRCSNFNFYWLLGFFAVAAVALLAQANDIFNDMERTTAFQFLLKHDKQELSIMMGEYNSLAFFNLLFVCGKLYLAMIFPSIACMLRFCDELNSGSSKFIIARIGSNRYIVKTILRTLITSFVITFTALYAVYIFLYLRMPTINDALAVVDPEQILEVKMIGDFYADGFLYVLRYIIPSSLTACIVGLLSVFVAAVSRNKFISITVPILIVEAENSICSGSINPIIYKYKISNFTYPFDNFQPWFEYGEFLITALIVCIVLIAAVYIAASRRFRDGE